MKLAEKWSHQSLSFCAVDISVHIGAYILIYKKDFLKQKRNVCSLTEKDITKLYRIIFH